jgi:hypothetical protein
VNFKVEYEKFYPLDTVVFQNDSESILEIYLSEGITQPEIVLLFASLLGKNAKAQIPRLSNVMPDLKLEIDKIDISKVETIIFKIPSFTSNYNLEKSTFEFYD